MSLTDKRGYASGASCYFLLDDLALHRLLSLQGSAEDACTTRSLVSMRPAPDGQCTIQSQNLARALEAVQHTT